MKIYFCGSMTCGREKQENYEQVINYFVSDIKTYNKNVISYNNYQATLGTGLSVIKYNTNKKYIDYNNDGKYDGKEE